MSQESEPKPRRRFRDEDVEKLKDVLTTGQQNYTPKSSSKSMRDLVNALRRDIVALRKRGFTVSMIADMIHEGGFKDVAPSTLRRYISETSASKPRQKRTVKPKPVRASVPPSQAPPDPGQSSDTPTRGAELTPIPDRDDL